MISHLKRHFRRAHRNHTIARQSGRVRLVVFRSLKAIYAQLVDDSTQKVLGSASSLKGPKGIAGATKVGEEIAKLAKTKKAVSVSFDRNGYRYHGQVKALAEAARKGGVEF